MGFRLSNTSDMRLTGVHPHLVAIVKRAIQITEVDFCVTEGMRSLARQKKLLASGASTTMKSRHLTGHAVDLAAMIGKTIHWDWPLYYKLADAMKKAAAELGYPIEWGGDWKTFKDGPHFQLPWKDYP